MSPEAVWHVTSEQASAYAGHALPEPDTWSVELHLEACTPCARRVSDAVRAGVTGPVLRDVRAGVLAAAGDGLAGP
ncbi:MAG TPA: hypothetical protein DEQ61_26525, partial [Streptomyces sp.]|nr:hypothetical protein [Streptomyces sp.]